MTCTPQFRPQFRPAVEEDFSAIAALIDDAQTLFRVHPGGHYPWDEAQLRQLADERTALTVMLSGGTVCGFANLYHFTAGKYAFIGNVIIGSMWRGRGLGRRLVSHMLDIMRREHELPEARISVFAENRAALTLYRSLGFFDYGEELRQTPDGEQRTLLHLRRSL